MKNISAGAIPGLQQAALRAAGHLEIDYATYLPYAEARWEAMSRGPQAPLRLRGSGRRLRGPGRRAQEVGEMTTKLIEKCFKGMGGAYAALFTPYMDYGR